MIVAAPFQPELADVDPRLVMEPLADIAAVTEIAVPVWLHRGAPADQTDAAV